MRFSLMIRRIETDVRSRCEWVSPEGMGRFGARALTVSGVWSGRLGARFGDGCLLGPVLSCAIPYTP